MEAQNIVGIDQEMGKALDRFWTEAVSKNQVWIKVKTGEQGGVIQLGPGKFGWSCFDKSGQQVQVPEREEERGLHQVVKNWLRIHRPNAPKDIHFGPIESTQRPSCCGFFESEPNDPRSIARRPWLGIIGGSTKLAAIANVFPYVANGHFMALPAEFSGDGKVMYPHVPQALTPEFAADLLKLAISRAGDWVVGWNSIAAGATVDHCHAHLLRSDPFPVERKIRLRVGRFAYPFGWPAGCLVIEDADTEQVVRTVNRLQEGFIPFNLLVRKRAVFVFGRHRDRQVVPEFPTGVMAVSELSGRVLVSDERIFSALTEDLISSAMKKTTLSVEELLGLLE